jgi:phosphoglycerate dehydrogenase-like enzyme
VHVSLTDIVVQSEHLSDEAAAWLAERCSVRVCPHDDPGFPQAVSDAAGLVVRTYTTVDRRLLDSAPRLRVVGRAGTGLDSIDVEACRARGIEVVYTPEANTQAVVEYVMGLLVDAVRARPALREPVDAARWRELRAEAAGQRQLGDLTLGILGLGRVGRRVAAVAAAIRFDRVLYNDLVEIPPSERSGARPVPVNELFARADVLSLHVDGRPGNRHFVGAGLIGRMKGDVILINTARGFVVDSAVLAQFLRTHPAALALLDVHEQEPFDEDYPLLGLPNVRLYPHLASRTQSAMRQMSWVVRDVVAVLEGRKPDHPAP